jgi:uncharacterized membrane protein
MRYQFKKYPIDIILFILWSIILLPIVFLNIEEILRIIIGLPFILFIPGYMLIFILFPMKNESNSINGLERIGLSFGFSIAIVSLLGLLLNFTPWGIQLISVLLSLFFVIESLGLIAFFRWKTVSPKKRFTISVDISQFKSSSKIEKILTIFLILSIVLGLSSVVYIIVQPKVGEAFTDFYILPQNENTTNYPQEIYTNTPYNLTIGLINHEYKTMDYYIEVWLIEYVIANETTPETATVYNHTTFLNEIVVTLNHTGITNERNQTKKWESPYTFSIHKKGYYKLEFLLYKTPPVVFDPKQDYKDSINKEIANAYRELHLWFIVGA